MMTVLLLIISSVLNQCTAQEYFYKPFNVTRSTLSGVAAYRSALTLDWLAAEDSRQRELALAFETEASPPARALTSDCIAYPKPASGKVARLMLELLKNLEGDDGTLISDLIQALLRSKLLVETSMLEAEPDLESLVKTPGVMMGEPHATFPRILAMVWMTASDPIATKRYGWCPISKVNRYISATRPVDIAEYLHALDPVIARARFIMEEFIQHVTPINVYSRTSFGNGKKGRSNNEYRFTTAKNHFPTRTPFADGHTIHANQTSEARFKSDLMGNAIQPELKNASDAVQISLCSVMIVYLYIVIFSF